MIAAASAQIDQTLHSIDGLALAFADAHARSDASCLEARAMSGSMLAIQHSLGNTAQATREITKFATAIAMAVRQVDGEIKEHRRLLEAGNQQSEHLATNFDDLAQRSQTNPQQLGAMQQALSEHQQANHALSEQLQQVNGDVQVQSTQTYALHDLTRYLNQLTTGSRT